MWTIHELRIDDYIGLINSIVKSVFYCLNCL